MNNILIEALTATGLGTLAEAYTAACTQLQEFDISDLNAISFSALTGAQACYLEIIRSTEQLLPFLTRRAESGDGFVLGIIPTLVIAHLNDASYQLLENPEEKSSEISFDPAFALSTLLRQSLMMWTGAMA